MRGVCVSECEDGLQMVGWWRFMDERWLCNASVWDGRGMCDLSAAASTLQRVCLHTAGLLWPGTPFHCLSLSSSLGHWEQEKRNTSGNDYDSGEK